MKMPSSSNIEDAEFDKKIYLIASDPYISSLVQSNGYACPRHHKEHANHNSSFSVKINLGGRWVTFIAFIAAIKPPPIICTSATHNKLNY